MDELSPKREIKQGRRAGNLFQTSSSQNPTPNDAGSEEASNSAPVDNKRLSPKPARKQGGWAVDAKDKKKNEFGDEYGKGKGGKEDEDERLRQDATTILLDNDTDDIPVIPDLEEFQDDDMANQVAAPPSVQVTRVATYKELDHDFEKHAGLLTLDGDIDLKLLGSVLSPESEVCEEDKTWEWDRIFTEVSSDLRSQWEKSKAVPDGDL